MSLTAAVALAQDNSNHPPGARLEGQVIDAQTEMPLNKVTVELYTSGSTFPDRISKRFRAITNSDGKFLFENVNPAPYSVTAVRSRYSNLLVGGHHLGYAGPDLELAAGDYITGMVLKLHKQGLITGRVRSSNGIPVSNAALTLWRVEFENGSRILRNLSPDSSAAEDGSFVLGGLDAGRYYLSAAEPQSIQVQLLNTAHGAGLPRTFYPDTTNFREAKPIDIEPGREVRDIQMVLKAASLYRLSGKAANPAPSAPVLERRLWLGLLNPLGGVSLSYGPATLAGNGTFEFARLPSGTYFILGVTKVQTKAGPRTFTARQEIQIAGAHSTGNNLIFAPTALIEGTSRDTTSSDPQMRVAVTVTSSEALSRDAVSIETNGTFQLQAPPGEYRAFAGNRIFNRQAVAITFEGAPVLNKIFRIEPSGGRMEVLFADRGGEVKGIARDERNRLAPGAIVGLWADGGWATSTVADPTGRFRLFRIPPGSYRLGAWEGVEQGIPLSAQFLKEFESVAAPLKVEDDSRMTMDVRALSKARAESVIIRMR